MIPDPYYRLTPDHLSAFARLTLHGLRARGRPPSRRRLGFDVPIAHIELLRALDELSAAGLVTSEGSGPATRIYLTEDTCRKSA